MTVRGLVFLLVSGVVLAGPVGWMGHPAQSAPYTINVATANIEGYSKAILTDTKGFTLYYLTSDTPTSSACTDACAVTWPPVLSDATPTGPSSLKGTLAAVRTANGSQVSYNGHLLYRYAADAAPGQMNGYGLVGPRGGRWSIALASLTTSDTPAERKGGY